MNKIIILLFSCFIFLHILYAASPHWSWDKNLSLEKEQVYKVNFLVGEVQKELAFRWTLFKNEGLVIHLNYDKFNHQIILYTDYQRNAYKIPLGVGDNSPKNKPYLLLFFKSFADKKAHINLYIEGQGVNVLDENIQEVQS